MKKYWESSRVLENVVRWFQERESLNKHQEADIPDRTFYMKISFPQGFSFCSWSISKRVRFTHGNMAMAAWNFMVTKFPIHLVRVKPFHKFGKYSISLSDMEYIISKLLRTRCKYFYCDCFFILDHENQSQPPANTRHQKERFWNDTATKAR